MLMDVACQQNRQLPIDRPFRWCSLCTNGQLGALALSGAQPLLGDM